MAGPTFNLSLNSNDPYGREDGNAFTAVGDFVTKGIPGALVSAGVGFVNTAASIGNVFGGDFEGVDTYDLLNSWGMEGTADYYEANQGLVDGVGFMAGALVPGLTAIRGLKSVQSGIALNAETRMLTGFERALLPESVIAGTRNNIRQYGATGASARFQSDRIRNYVQGFHQQALEAVAFEGAVLLTMNQATSIGPEDLDYFEGITSNLGGAGFGLILGTAFGGVLQNAVEMGAARKLLKQGELEEKGLLKIINEGARNNFVQGDVIVQTADSWLDRRAQLLSPEFGQMTPGQRSSLTSGESAGEMQLRTQALKFFKGDAASSNQFVDRLKEMPIDEAKETATRVFSGQAEARNLREADSVFNVPISQVAQVLDHDYANFIVDFNQKYNRQKGLPPPTFEELRQIIETEQGSAFPYSAGDRIKAWGVSDLFDGGVRGMSRISASKTELDWEDLWVWRHETGHILTNETMSTISRKSKFGKVLHDQAVNLSRNFSNPVRKRNWEAADIFKELQATGRELTPDQLKHLNYMDHPDEIFADAWAAFNHPTTGAQAVKENPELYKFMLNNKMLDAKLRPGKAVLDISTGRVLDEGVVPTVADLGGEVRITRDYVEYGPQRERVNLNSIFGLKNIEEWTAEKANALYSAAKTRKDITPDMQIEFDDIPRLSAAYVQDIPVRIMRNGQDITDRYTSLEQHLFNSKLEVGRELQRRSRAALAESHEKAASEAKKLGRNVPLAREWVDGPGTLSPEQLARVLDTGEDFVNKLDSYYALFNHNEGQIRGFPEGLLVETRDLPYYSLRADYNPLVPTHKMIIGDRRAIDSDGRFIQGVTESHLRIKAEREAAEGLIAAALPDIARDLPAAAYASEVNIADQLTSGDSTVGFLQSGNADYDSVGSMLAQWIGKLVSKQENKSFAQVDMAFETQIQKLAADADAVYEAAALDSRLRSVATKDAFEFIPENLEEMLTKFVAPEGTSGPGELVLQAMNSVGLDEAMFGTPNQIWSGPVRNAFYKLLYTKSDNFFEIQDAAADVLKLFESNNVFQIKNAGLAKFWRDMVDYNRTNIVPNKNNLASLYGRNTQLNGEALYPGSLDTRNYQFHAIVKLRNSLDPLAEPETGMILARTQEELRKRVDDAKELFGQENIDVFTDPKIKAYKEAKAEYENDRLFKESYVDSAMQRRGIAYDVMPTPNANLFLGYTNSLKDQHRGIIRQAVEFKYMEEIAGLNHYSNLIDEYNSTFGSAEKTRNVYKDIRNMMVNKRPEDPDNLWNKLNTVTSQKFNLAWSKLAAAGRSTLDTGNWQLMNEKLEQLGFKHRYSDATSMMLNNLQAPAQTLEEFTAKSNWFLATSLLRMDVAHSLVNTVSMPIMAIPEMKNLLKSASAARLQILRDGSSIRIPGTDHVMDSASPMLYQAVKDVASDPKLAKRYLDDGIINSLLDDVAQLREQFADIPNKTDVGEVRAFFDRAIEVMSTPTDMSEQLVKAVSARMAELAADTLGIVGNQRKALMNTFVTRVNGNYLASQRPQLFQGWMGQAIGLFQTYQFNLIQSLLKNVQNRNKNAVASMIGLQSGIFGTQSLPGFEMLNNYIGQRSMEGNDFYSSTQGALGDDVSKWVLYGAASNAAVPIVGEGLDLFARGDLTPRTPILIPTSPMETPIVQSTVKTFNSILNAANQISQGAPVGRSMLDALSNQGFSRPLQGLAQLIAGERTTARGQLLTTFESWDLWNIATRAIGTKPLDEAVAVDTYYRTLGYQSARQERLNTLGQAVRSNIRAGVDDPETYYDFMEKYVQTGGRPEYFQRWMTNQYKNASESQINQLRRRNQTPEGQYLQNLMGSEIPDYTNDNRGYDAGGY